MNPEFNTIPGGGENRDHEWLSMSEASGLTPYSAEYLSLLARKKKLAAKKVGKTWYTTKAVLDEYMKRQMMRSQIQNGDMSAVKGIVQGDQSELAAHAALMAPVPEMERVPISERGDMIVYMKKGGQAEQQGQQAEQPEIPAEPLQKAVNEELKTPAAASPVPVEDHPSTIRVRTYHGDLKAYLDSINSKTATVQIPTLREIVKPREKAPVPKVEAPKITLVAPVTAPIARPMAVPAVSPKIQAPHIEISKPPVSPVHDPIFASFVSRKPLPKIAPSIAPRVAPVLHSTYVPPVPPVASTVPPKAPALGTSTGTPAGLDAIALTLAEIATKLEKISGNSAMGQGMGGISQAQLKMLRGQPNIVTRSFQIVFGRKPLIYAAIGLILFFTIFPTPFVFGFFDGAVSAVKKVWNDSNTVMGFRPGTHENEVLLLDKQGNISIMGHIQTDGQFQSYAKDGIAPIVVDSKTLVKNLNAEFVGGVSATEFTLAYVTKNGNVTTDDVYLEGGVEVGKTLLVKGATHLLSDLEVDGNLAVFGDAKFSKSLTVAGPAIFETILNAANIKSSGIASLGEVITTGNVTVGKNIHVRGSIDAGASVTAHSASFGSLGVSGDFSAKGEIALGNSKDTLTISSKNFTVDADGNVNVAANEHVEGNLSVTGTITAGNINLSGITTAANISVTDLTATNTIAINSTTTNATTTNFFATLAHIISLAVDNISVGALTATDTTAVNSTTTNATTTNSFATNAVTTNSTSTNEYVANLIALNAAITQASLSNALITNSTTTNATTTNFYADNGTIQNLAFTDATGTNATTTSIFSSIAHFTTGVIDNFTSTNFTVVNQTVTNSIITNGTTTNATSSNFATGNLTATGTVAFTGVGANMLLSLDGQNQLVSTATPQVAAIFATSSTATSTFAGGFTVGGVNFIVDRATGFVGIGTSSPSQSLSVLGNQYLTGGLGVGKTNTSAGTLETAGTAGIGSTLFLRSLLNCNSASASLQTDGSGIVSCGSVTAIAGTSAGGWTYVDPNIVRLSTTTDMVGIGTTTPGAKLSVSSGAVGTTTLALAAVNGQTANILTIFDNALNLSSVIDASGRFGIGTSSPSQMLSVQGNALISGNLFATNATTTNFYSSLLTAGNNALVVNAAGNVGIGTSSPQYKLDIEGNSALWQSVYGTEDGLLAYWALSEGTGSTIYDRSPNGNDATLINTTAPSWTSGKYGSAVSFVAGAGTNYMTTDPTKSVFPDGTITGITYEMWINTTSLTTAVNNRMMCNHQFGSHPDFFCIARIGDSLSLQTTDNSSNDVIFTVPNTGVTDGNWHYLVATYDATSQMSKLYKDGVLIGSASTASFADVLKAPPIWQIDIAGRGSNENQEKIDEIKVYNRAISADEVKAHYLRTGTSNFVQGVFRVVSTTTTATNFIVNASGSVGIGTTSPFGKLSVAGNTYIGGNLTATGTTALQALTFTLATGTSATTTNFFSTTASSTNLFTSLFAAGGNTLVTTAAGNVGIGTTTPGAKLAVTSTGTQLLLGYDATHSVGIASNALGDLLLMPQASNTVSTIYMGGQKFIQSSAGAPYSLAIGYGSQPNLNTNEYGNVSVGYGSLGSQATDNYFNTAVGTNALASNVTNQNTAFGYGAASNVTTGGANVAVGTYAMAYNSTGGSNTVVGQNAGGYNAGSATSFSSNSVFGTQAGIGLTSGSRNILLGASVAGNLTTGSNNIIIGYNISATSSTATNSLNIGNLLFGTGLDGSGTTLSTGNIGIGTTTPWAKLSVTNTGTGPSFIVEDSTSPDTTPFVIDASGNVGIGTTTPSDVFNVFTSVANTGITLDSSTNPEFKLVRSGTTRLKLNASGAIGTISGDGNGLQFQTDGTTRMYINPSTGNIGIGTTTPIQLLSVQGNGLFSGNIIAANITATGTLSFVNLLATGSSTLQDFTFVNATGSSATTTSSFATTASSTNLFTSALAVAGNTLVTSAGNVGLGTTNPSYQLDIISNSATANMFRAVRAATSRGLTINSDGLATFSTDTTTNPGSSNTAFSFLTHLTYVGSSADRAGIYLSAPMTSAAGTSNLTAMQVDGAINQTVTSKITRGLYLNQSITAASDYRAIDISTNSSSAFGVYQSGANTKNYFAGNVGIGTVSPDNVGFSKALTIASSNAPYDTGLELWANSDSIGDGTNVGGIQWLAGTGTAKRIAQISATVRGTSEDTADLSLATLNGGTVSTKMRITAAGNVGIGTTTPTSKLAIQFGASNSLNGITLYNETSAGGGSGNGSAINFVSDGFGTGWTQRIVGNNTNVLGNVNTAFRFFNTIAGIAPTEVASIVGGNVGIGSTSPYAKLSVTNTGTDPSFVVEDSTSPDSSPFVIDASGNVGIGTTTPSNLLSINGGLPDTPVLGTNSGKLGIFNLGLYGLVAGVFSNGTSYLQGQRIDGTATAYNILLNPVGGNVGIGTTTPGAKLDIAGATWITGPISAPQFRIMRDATPSQGLDVTAGGGLTTFSSLGNSVTGGFDFRSSSTGVGTSRLAMPSNSLNAGIGTTTPWARLTVTSDRISSGSGNLQPLFLIASSSLAVSTTTYMIIDPFGNVGLGTSNPTARIYMDTPSGYTDNLLDLRVNTNNQLALGPTGILSLANNNIIINPITGFFDLSSTHRDFTLKTAGSGDDMNFTSSALSVAAMTILGANGNVGLGSTTPWAQLSINPNGISGPAFAIGSSTKTNFQITNGGEVIMTNSNTTNVGLKMNDNGIYWSRPLDGAYVSSLVSDLTSQNNMILTASGNVLLKTSNGTVTYTFDGTSLTSPMYTSSGGTFRSSANTTMLLSADPPAGSVTGTASGIVANIGTRTAAGNTAIMSWMYGSYGTANGVEVARMTSNGRLGIGTTSPWALLSIGTTTNPVTPYFAIGASNGSAGTSTVFIVDTNGNVGIGTTTPTSRLHVNGAIQTEAVPWTMNKRFANNTSSLSSVTLYNGKLYAGYVGSATGDAAVMVYDGSMWATSTTFASFGGVRSLAVYNGKLYAGTSGFDCCSAASQGDVYVFDGATWSLSNDFGVQYESVLSMAVYNGNLYAGLGLASGDGDVYVYNGSSWSVSKDFGASVERVSTLVTYNGKLYAGLGEDAGDGDIWAYDGLSWAVSEDNGSSLNKVGSMAVYNGKLYAGVGGNQSTTFSEVHVFDGSTWAVAPNFLTTTFDAVGAAYVSSMAVYNGRLYVGSGGGNGMGDVYVFDGNTWSKSKAIDTQQIYGLAVYDGKLYAAAGGSNSAEGQVWIYSERLESQLLNNQFANAGPWQEQNQNLTKNLTILGSLGIGTTTPSQKLSVQGNGLFSGDIFAANITATGTLSFANLLATASTTLQDFTFVNATGSSATTTNFYSTTASSTNLYATTITGGTANLNTITGGAGGLTINSSGGAGTNIDLLSTNGSFNFKTTNRTVAGTTGTINVYSTNSEAVDLGGSIAFGGAYTGTTLTDWAAISGRKENTTDGNFAGYLSFATRPHAGLNTEAMRITSSGNVGIGTTSPSNPLSVASSGGYSAYFAGNVGIGVANPGVNLIIGSSGTPTIYLGASGMSVTGTSTLKFNAGIGASNNEFNINYFKNANSSRMGFVDGGAIEVLSLVSGGGVGIGTSSPTSLLSIQGTNPLIQQTITSASNDTLIGGFRGQSAGATLANMYGGVELHAQTGNNNNYLSFVTADSNTSQGERMRITKGGNVGIGTTTPWGQLSITNTSANPSFVVEDSTSPDGTPFIVDASGNVGIGAVSPSAKLDIIQNTSVTPGTTDFIKFSTVGPVSYWGFRLDSAADFVVDRSTNGSAWSEALTILNSNGNVGIGTTSPFAKLSVAGDAYIGGNLTATGTTQLQNFTFANATGTSATTTNFYATNFTTSNFTTIGEVTSNSTTTNATTTYLAISSLTSGRIPFASTGGNLIDNSALTFSNTSGTLTTTYASTTAITSSGSAFFAAGGGNVGIGTTSPTQVLSVQGNALFSGDISVAGITATSTITSSVDGYFNGVRIGKGNGSISDNVVVGNGLNVTTTGAHNTAIGGDALLFHTSGDYNTALGQSALRKLTTGRGNVAIGAATLSNATSTYANVAIGLSALEQLAGDHVTGLGEANVAIGQNALAVATSTKNSVAIGYYAASSVTSGSTNVAIGFQTMLTNTTGSGNTAVGYRNFLLGTGSNNTILGNSAGNNLTTGDANIMIGYNVSAPDATASNQLNIGNTIYGNLSTGKIGIGTTTPGSKLTIGGGGAFISDTDDVSYGLQTYGSGGEKWELRTQRTGQSFPGFFIRNSSEGTNYAYITEDGLVRLGKPTASLTNANGLNIDISGNVGIGTTTPTHKLVVGNPLASNSVHSGNSIIGADRIAAVTSNRVVGLIAPDSATGFASIFGYDYGVSAATNLALNQFGGNVGIGTTSPSAKLEVSGTGGAQSIGMKISAGSNHLVFADTTTASKWWQYLSGNDLRFFDNADRLTLQSGGNVGIGTTTPGALFAVGAASATNHGFYVTNNTAVGIGTSNPQGILHIATQGTRQILLNGGAVGAAATDGVYMGISVPGQNDFAIQNQESGDFYLGTNNITNMVLKSTGRVGVGSTTPGATLGVQGNGLFSGDITAANITATGTLSFANLLATGSTTLQNFTFLNATGSSATTTNFFSTTASSTNLFSSLLTVGGDTLVTTATGRVGVGVSNPTQLLSLSSTAAAGTNLFIDQPTGGTGDVAIMLRTQGSQDWTLGIDRSDTHKFKISNSTGLGTTDRLTIDTSGNVGVGTTSPFAKLSVAGTGWFDSTILASNFRTDIGTSNTFVGVSAGNTTGAAATNQNTAVGNSVLGAITTGNNNTILGYSSGNALTIGGANVAIGNNSMTVATSTVGAVAVGYGALGSLRTGSTVTVDLVAIGINALNANTYGISNTAIGASAAIANTTGVENTAVGARALKDNTTASYNTALGSYAMNLNQTGKQNTAIGRYALGNALTASDDNTAVGMNAFLSTSGAGNTGIGRSVGATLTTGSNNTLLGFLADVGVNSLTNATAIGYSAVVGASNSLVLGGTGANAVNVGIGTTTPSAKLSITGAGSTTGRAFAIANSSDAEKLTVLDNGNVGIGTTSPGTILSLGNTPATTGAANFNISAAGNLMIMDTGSFNVIVRNLNAADGQVPSGAALGSTGAGKVTVGYLGASGGGAVRVNFSHNGSNSGFAISHNWTDLFNIDSSGNVGIGTTSPLARLDVAGTNNGTAPLFQLSSVASFATTTRFIVTNAGNVGVGTTSPAYPLSVVKNGGVGSTLTLSGNVRHYITLETTNQETWRMGFADDGTNAFGIYNQGEGGFPFYIEDGADAGSFRINPAGNVGLGSTSPWGKLSVTNTGTGPSFIVEDATSPDASPFIIDASGNVGIGTTSPYQNLSVAGNAVVTGNTYLSTAGAYVTGDSSGSLYQFTTGNGSTYTNIAGTYKQVINSNGVAINNGSTGAASGVGLVVGSGNVGIGTTTPGQKLSVAGDILGNNLIGKYFTATSTSDTSLFNGFISSPGTASHSEKFGAGALAGGADSLAIGYNASSSQTGNIAIGSGALAVSGNTSTAIGTGAITGAASVAVGYSASTASGSSGVVVGANSSLTGTGGIAIGSAVTAANTAVGIGYTASAGGTGSLALGAVASAAFSNSAAIGNNVTAAAANQFWYGNSSVLQHIFQAGNVGIGTTSPFTKLSVAGSAYIGGNLTATGTVSVTGTDSQGSPYLKIDNASSTFFQVASSTGFKLDGGVVTPTHKGKIVNGTGGASINSPRSVFVSGDYAYVASGAGNALEIINISDPRVPVHVGTLTNGSGGALLAYPQSVFVSGNYAYVAASSSNALEIVNISNPASPVHAGSIANGAGGALLGAPQDVFVSGNYAYVVASTSNALEIIDISNPAAPVHKGSIVNGAGSALLAGPTSVFVQGNYAYVTAGVSNALEIIDISNPAAPVHRGSIPNPTGTLVSPSSVYVSGNYAYVASTGSNALEIIDVSNPAGPAHLSALADGSGGAVLSGPSSVFVSGNYAYVTASTSNALEVVDISNPSAPAHKGVIRTGTGGAVLAGASEVFVQGNYAYVVSGSNALEAVDIGSGSIANIQIGNVKVDALQVQSFAQFNQNVSINGGLNIGTNALVSGMFGATGTSTFMGNVGIGTTSPWAQLSINPNGVSGPEFAIGSSTRTDFVVTNGGTIGIGTAAPTYRVQIHSNSAGITQQLGLTNFTAAAANVGSELDFSGIGDIRQAYIIGAWEGAANSDGYLSFSTRGSGSPTEKMRVTGAGNVGIGTTSPWGKLSVTNTGTGPSFIVEDATSPDTTSFIVDYMGNVGVGVASTTAKLDVGGAIAVSSGYGTGAWTTNNSQNAYAFFGAGGSTPNAGSLSFGNNSGWKYNIGTQVTGVFTPRMTLVDTGNVGIGTTSPSSNLDVAGSAPVISITPSTGNTLSALYLKNPNLQAYGGVLGNSGTGEVRYGGLISSYFPTFYSSGSEVMRISTGGNVGIGTTTPASLLNTTLTNSAGTQLLMSRLGSQLGATAFDFNSGDSRMGYLRNFRLISGIDTSGSFTGGTERFTVLTTGETGIGTTTPWGQLSITNTSANPSFVVEDSTSPDGTPFIVDASGNVGIGAVSPSAKLDILQNTSVTPGTTDFIKFSTVGPVSYWGFRLDSAADFAVDRSTNGSTWSESMTILNSNGNVGIGTTTPWGQLAVYGGSASVPVLNVQSNLNSGNAVNLLYLSSGNTQGVAAITDNGRINTIGDIFAGYSGGNTGSTQIVKSSNNATLLMYNSSAASTNFLTTNGSSYINGGNVGIGTTTPNNKLDIYSTTKAAIGFSGAGDSTYKWTIGEDVTNGGKFTIASSTALGTSNRFVIDGNGNVGIATSTPSATSTLDVYGNLYIDGSNRYLNFGSTYGAGATGFGLRENGGIIEFRNAYSSSTAVSSNWMPISSAASARYQLTENGWTNTGSTLPSALDGSQSVVIGDYVYLFGGFTSAFDSIIYRAPISNPTNWTNTGATLPGNLAYSQAAVIGDYIYLFGGRDAGGQLNVIYRAPVSNPTNWSNTGATLPSNLGSAQLAVIGDYVYLFGGSNGTTGKFIYRALVTNPLSWSDTGAVLPGNLAVSQLRVIGDYVYLFGGFNGTTYTNVIYRAPVADPTSWTDTGATLPGNLGYSQAIVIGDYVYLFGGYDGTSYLSLVYRAPVADPTRWSNTGTVLPTTDRAAQAAIIGDYVYLFGGSTTGGSQLNTVYRAPITSNLNLNKNSTARLNAPTGPWFFATSSNSNLSFMAGNVGIGTTTPGAALDVIGALCVDDATPTCANAARTAGTIYSVAALSATLDLAESYPTKDVTLEAGEIVSLDPLNPVFVSRASHSDSTPLVGVVSTKPGFWLGGFNDELYVDEIKKPIALSGRVPVKVTDEGGSITVGDRIALSSTPGMGMKQIGSGETVGIALESMDMATGTIEVFVNLKQNNAANQFVVNSNGNVGIGTTTPDYKLQVAGDIAATAFVNVSTRTAKKDITYVDDAGKLSMLAKLKTVGVATYHYNSESENMPLRMGLIAEEAPSEVLADSGKGVDVYKLSTFILAGVQEMAKKLDDLDTRVAANTADIATLQATVAALQAQMASSTLAAVSADNGTTTATTTITWSSDFGTSLLTFLENSIVHIKELVAETFSANIAYIKNATIESASVEALTVGSTSKRSGITLYDQYTGDPYCLSIAAGQTRTISGVCPLAASSTPPVIVPEPGISGSLVPPEDSNPVIVPAPVPTDEGTTTSDNVGTTTPDTTDSVASSTPDGAGDVASSTPDAVDQTVTPVPEPTPEPTPNPVVIETGTTTTP